MEAVKKYWFLGIFISILTVFAMSHNANAVEAVFDISNYDLVTSLATPGITCTYSDSTTFSNSYCPLTSSKNKILSLTLPTMTLEQGDIITFDIVAFGSTKTYITDEAPSGGYNLPLEFPNTLFNNYVHVLSIDSLQFGSDEKLTSYYNDLVCYARGTGYDCSGYPEIGNTYSVYQAFRVTLKTREKLTEPIILNGNSFLPFLSVKGSNASVNVLFTRYVVWRLTETQENKEQEQKTQAASDASETAGGSSSSDAQTGTTSLINAITGAVTVISSASPTNCRINGNMGNLDLGQLDLCANPAPAFVTTIGSLILILMCVPLAITLFNRFISLFRSFQS